MNFEQILEFIHSQNPFLIYAILLISAFIENIVPPFPGDAVILAGAFVAGEGNIDYIGVLIAAVAGGTFGALVLFFIGRKVGRNFFTVGKGRFLIKGNLHRAESLYDRHGTFLILISRFLAGVRSAIAVAAGIVNFDVYRMTIFTFLSFVLWNSLLLGLMIYSKSNWNMIVEIIKSYNIAILIIGSGIVIVWIIRAIRRKKRNLKSPS